MINDHMENAVLHNSDILMLDLPASEVLITSCVVWKFCYSQLTVCFTIRKKSLSQELFLGKKKELLQKLLPQ